MNTPRNCKVPMLNNKKTRLIEKSILDLPIDCVCVITSYLSSIDFIKVMRLNKDMHSLLAHKDFFGSKGIIFTLNLNNRDDVGNSTFNFVRYLKVESLVMDNKELFKLLRRFPRLVKLDCLDCKQKSDHVLGCESGSMMDFRCFHDLRSLKICHSDPGTLDIHGLDSLEELTVSGQRSFVHEIEKVASVLKNVFDSTKGLKIMKLVGIHLCVSSFRLPTPTTLLSLELKNCCITLKNDFLGQLSNLKNLSIQKTDYCVSMNVNIAPGMMGRLTNLHSFTLHGIKLPNSCILEAKNLPKSLKKVSLLWTSIDLLKQAFYSRKHFKLFQICFCGVQEPNYFNPEDIKFRERVCSKFDNQDSNDLSGLYRGMCNNCSTCQDCDSLAIEQCQDCNAIFCGDEDNEDDVCRVFTCSRCRRDICDDCCTVGCCDGLLCKKCSGELLTTNICSKEDCLCFGRTISKYCAEKCSECGMIGCCKCSVNMCENCGGEKGCSDCFIRFCSSCCETGCVDCIGTCGKCNESFCSNRYDKEGISTCQIKECKTCNMTLCEDCFGEGNLCDGRTCLKDSECEDCSRKKGILLCDDCQRLFCSKCWGGDLERGVCGHCGDKNGKFYDKCKGECIFERN